MSELFEDFIRNISWVWKVPKLAYLHKEIRWVCAKYYVFAILRAAFKLPLIPFYVAGFVVLCVWEFLKVFGLAVKIAYAVVAAPSVFFHDKVRAYAKTIRDFRTNNNC